MAASKVTPQQMLDWARAIVLREQDVAARERDIAHRRTELDDRQQQLETRRHELEQLKLQFAELAGDHPRDRREVTTSPPAEIGQQAGHFLPANSRPPLARATETIAQRVLVVLDMEPRAFSPAELFNVLELPPPIETLRTTLWKMAQRGLIARPLPGHYCARQHEEAVLRASENAG